MAKKILKASAGKSKEGFRGKLTRHEIALIAELYGEVRAGRMTIQQMAARFA